MKSLLTILAFIIITNTAKAQLSGQAKIDSLLTELPKMKQDTNGVNFLVYLSNEYLNINNDEGIKCGEQALLLSEKVGWELGKAKCYNSLGALYSIGKANYPKALEFYLNAVKIFEAIDDKQSLAGCFGNLGLLYIYQNNYPKALEYLFTAIKSFEELGDKISLAKNLLNVGNAYLNQKEFSKANEYYQRVLELNKEIGDKRGTAIILGNLGIINAESKKFDIALHYYKQSTQIFEELGQSFSVAINFGQIADLYLAKLEDVDNTNYENRNTKFLNKEMNINIAIDYLINCISILDYNGAIHPQSFFLNKLAEAYEMKGDYKKAYEAYKEHKTLQDSIFSNEKAMDIANLEAKRENELKDKEIELLLSNQEKQVLRTYSLIGGLVALAIIIGIIFFQRKKSEKLLLNILPAKIAKRLKRKEENIADDFENATTIFIDLVGFTSFAKDKRASEVVKVLNNIFHRFDDLVNKHGLEKIKTMGDGYLAVSGVPDPDTNHCQKAINFALDIRKEIENFNKETRLNINARIGLETGPLVAGVIGSSKFIYDIWGDSVNTASRMESTGTPGKIQITENVKNELEKQTTDLQFEEREAFEVKGKGTMQTYFIEKETIEG